MKLLYSIIDQILNSEFTDKVAGVGGGMTASILTFVNSGFGDFLFKCTAAAIFALIGGFMGYAGKKIGEKIFNYYKQKKQSKNANKDLS
jgi:hypothetical protein